MEEMKSVIDVPQPEVQETEADGATVGGKCPRLNWKLMTAVAIMSIFNACSGGVDGYPSPAIPNLNANRNPFHVSDNEWSWITSLSSLGFSVGSLAIGTTSDRLGRKLAMMTSALLTVVSLAMVTASTGSSPMYVSVFLQGLFTAINSTVAVLYMAEVSPVRVRAVCTSITAMSYSMGTVLCSAAGAFLPWNWLAVFCASWFAIPVVILAFLPESPYWFCLRGNREAAFHGLRWYHGECDEDQIEAIDRCHQETSQKSNWKDLATVKEQRTSLIICIVIHVLEGSSGIFPLHRYTVTILELAGSTEHASNLLAIVIGLASVFGGIACPLIIDRVGRRNLLIASTATMSFSMAVTGVFFRIIMTDPDFARQRLSSVPLVGLSLCNFAFSAGLLSVPYLLVCEMFPTSTRGNANAVNSMALGLSSFVSTKMFIQFNRWIGTSGTFFLYASICAAITLFVKLTVKQYKPEYLR